MKMTNFKSLPNLFGVFVGLIMVFCVSLSSEVSAQARFGLPILKTKNEIAQVADEQIASLSEERQKSCTIQDPTAPCVKRIFALMESYNLIKGYIIDMPWMNEYEILKAIYPISNMHNLSVLPQIINNEGFDNQQYNPYFTEILLRVKQ